MSDLTFSQPERRSFLVPFLLSIAALALAVVVAVHFFPATTVNIEEIHTDVLPTKTVYKSQSIVVGQNETVETLLVATTVKVDNELRVPVFVDDYSLTLVDAKGAELAVKGALKSDLEGLEQSFPAVGSLMKTPLLRDTKIDPGKSAQGTVLFSLSVPKELWDARGSATVKVDLYHQQSVYVTIPK